MRELMAFWTANNRHNRFLSGLQALFIVPPTAVSNQSSVFLILVRHCACSRTKLPFCASRMALRRHASGVQSAPLECRTSKWTARTDLLVGQTIPCQRSNRGARPTHPSLVDQAMLSELPPAHILTLLQHRLLPSQGRIHCGGRVCRSAAEGGARQSLPDAPCRSALAVSHRIRLTVTEGAVQDMPDCSKRFDGRAFLRVPHSACSSKPRAHVTFTIDDASSVTHAWLIRASCLPTPPSCSSRHRVIGVQRDSPVARACQQTPCQAPAFAHLAKHAYHARHVADLTSASGRTIEGDVGGSASAVQHRSALATAERHKLSFVAADAASGHTHTIESAALTSTNLEVRLRCPLAASHTHGAQA